MTKILRQFLFGSEIVLGVLGTTEIRGETDYLLTDEVDELDKMAV